MRDSETNKRTDIKDQNTEFLIPTWMEKRSEGRRKKKPQTDYRIQIETNGTILNSKIERKYMLISIFQSKGRLKCVILRNDF